MISKLIRILTPIAIVIGLVGCNGGGAGGTSVAGGGIGGSGSPVASFGEVTQFGSVFVNGVEFDTTAAKIIKDDVELQASDLLLGMTVEVHGSIDSATKGTAEIVFVDEAVRGEVESVSNLVSDNKFTILGQDVLVDQSTKFAPGTTINDITNGQLLEVHGLVKNYGTIQATFIQKFSMAGQPPSVTRYSVRGFVDRHTPAAMSSGSLTIGPLTVTYDASTIIDDTLPADLTNVYLDIKGDSCMFNGNVCSSLHAVSIDFEGFPTTVDVNKVEMEGFVRETSTDPNRFTVAGQTVEVVPGTGPGATVFVDGLQSDMVIGVKVQVEGSLSNGVLTATKIEFEDNILESVATVDTTTNTFTLAGFSSIVIHPYSTAVFTGGATSNLTSIDGKRVRVRGRAESDTVIAASEIELRSSGSSNVFIKGVAQSISSPSFKILSISIDTSTVTQFSGANGTLIDQATFFNALSKSGTHTVKAQGSLIGSTVTWKEVEIED